MLSFTFRRLTAGSAAVPVEPLSGPELLFVIGITGRSTPEVSDSTAWV